MGDPTRRRETLYLPSFSRMRQFSRSCLKTMRIPPKKKDTVSRDKVSWDTNREYALCPIFVLGHLCAVFSCPGSVSQDR